MLGQQLGPYTIEAELGSGGMGTVYRAEGPDGVVALKVVHPHLLAAPGFFKRFLREAEVGRRVDHPNVVRTLDCDQLGGHMFLVMEHVQGKSLRELLKDLGTIPETLLREIALQAAAGLAAIHASGIVHRDLKPENILITDDHEIRIMDLGVAKLQEATIELTKEGQFAGSLLYAAPEQFRGDVEVGPASDLYSLGILLYELATGENPFRRDDASQVIDAQLHFEPPRIHDTNAETTRFLAELVACLLAKDPGQRFASAAALRDVLQQAERSAWWTALAPALDRRPRPRVRVRRETKLHGRAGDLERLHDAWERAKAGEGNTVWIDGEAGIGKTRLIAEFLDGIGDDAHVLYGSYPPSGGLGGLSDAILEKFGETDLIGSLAPYLTVTPSLVPALAALVRHESPPTGSEPLQGDALNAVCVHLMRALAGERPLLWIIEDLHFAQKESRDVVLSLARAVEGHSALVIASARPGVPDDELANFSRLENFDRRTLARLGGREIVELLQDAFRSEVLADKLGARIALKSDGVPFFAFEMIRGLKEGQFIQEQADGSYIQTRVVEDIEVPSAVKDLIEGRLHGLAREQRAILDVGAVQGLTFDPQLVAEVLEQKTVRVLQEVAEVERHLGLVRGEAGAVRFDQNQIQEVLYHELIPDLRAEYHTLVADAIRKRSATEPRGESAVLLASHYLRGRSPQTGVPYVAHALDHLEQLHQNGRAIGLAGLALEKEGLFEGAERAEILLRKAGRHDLRADREEERAALDEALGLAKAAGDPVLLAKVRIALGWHLERMADHMGAQAALALALDLARGAGDGDLERRAMGNLGNVLWGLGRYDDARVQYEGALALARRMGDRMGEAVALGNLGNVFWSRGLMEEARPYQENFLALSRELGYRRGEANALGNLGLILLNLGRTEDALAYIEESLVVSREIGDRQGEARCTGNLGNVYSTLGRLGDALAQQERGLALTREFGYRRGEIITSVNLGILDRKLGRSGEARVHWERSLAYAREIGDPSQEGFALALLGTLAEQEGDHDAAVRLLTECLALRRRLDEKSAVADTLVDLARAEAARGEVESAVAHLDEALDLARLTRNDGTILSAAIERARLPGGDANDALAAFEETAGQVGHTGTMLARFGLWQLTQDKAHLEDAHRRLRFLRDHAPEAYRTSMIENVPIHRDILKAWEEHGQKE